MKRAFESTLPFFQSTLRAFAPGSLREAYISASRHAAATIILHWGTVMAIVIAVCTIYLRELVEDKPVRQAMLDLHRQLGLLVFIGVGLRLAVRYAVGLAEHSGRMHVMARAAAWVTHLGLYALLVVVPLLGWAASNAHGVKLDFFGVIPLPTFVEFDSDLQDTLDDFHKWSTWALGGLVLLHALAALWHHYFRKDSVLKAMLPGPRSR
jgi:cytochrome b561